MEALATPLVVYLRKSYDARILTRNWYGSKTAALRMLLVTYFLAEPKCMAYP